jgi:hypothetical protein
MNSHLKNPHNNPTNRRGFFGLIDKVPKPLYNQYIDSVIVRCLNKAQRAEWIVIMGQAKNRKAEIQALKANGPKKIKPFIIRGKIVDGLVEYDTSELDEGQRAFVDGCVKTINLEIIPESADTPTEETHLTLVSWNHKDDFIGTIMGPFHNGATPDTVYADAEMRFNKHHASYPQVGFTYTRDEIVELGTDMAGKMMDMLNEDAVWPWPNARAVFQKQGDKLVVIKSI